MALLLKARNRLMVDASRLLFRKQLLLNIDIPIISFTFDDFPRSAFLEGGFILGRYGARGTYYVALGLMGNQSPLGRMYESEDLKELARIGHELGCHTFAHCHSWDTPPVVYERAMIKNQEALNDVLPGTSFETFAYPFSAPRLPIKRLASKRFLCCRGGGLKPGRYVLRNSGGGQTFNSGITDLNLLSAFFLEKSTDDPESVKRLINQNARARGWLILATHDICDTPSPFGCTPDFFEQVVQWALESGARILPVVQALRLLPASNST